MLARPPPGIMQARLRFIAIALLLVGLAAAADFLTGETGHRVGSNQNSQTATVTGGILLQDIYAIEKLRRFDRERIPERVVHARGAGAHGHFTTTDPIPGLTAADFLQRKGHQTEIFVRFSTVIHSKHSPETARDPRGFAIKFKTEKDGIWDLVGNNLPVFFIRDQIKFADMVHSLKPDPVTHIQDPNRFFDFFAAIGGMATNMLTYLYSDLGIPKSYRFIRGNSVHAYKFVNADGNVTYVKFRWFPHQGVRNLTVAEAAEVQGRDFHHATRDLYDAIRAGDHPVWDMKIQTMSPSQLDNFDFNPLDATKEWPESQFPFRKIGELVLDRVPANFHQFSEQAAFCPGNFLPGAVEPSEDRLLQGRLLSYHDTQVHRLGSANFNDLPVNRPRARMRNYGQDGVMSYRHHWQGSVNYEPSGDAGAYREDPRALMSQMAVCGATEQKAIRKTLQFRAAGDTFRAFDTQQQENLIANLAGDLGRVWNMKVRNTMCAHFYKADEMYGKRIAGAVKCSIEEVKRIAEGLKE